MKYLKNFAILIALVVFNSNLCAQDRIVREIEDIPVANPLETQERGRNIISCSAYDSIKYNGYTIEQINATEGEETELQTLFGNYSNIRTEVVIGANTYYYGENSVYFYDNDMRSLKVKDSNWPITILGKNVSVGNSFSNLQQKFGNDLKIRYTPSVNADYSVSFNCEGNDGDGMLIHLNPSTNKVVDITYYVNP